jgi:TM2 domain-containing membrane protein YozV
MKSKSTAAVLAFFLGGLGGHKFYLGQTGMGILYLLFCWTFIPSIVALIEFIMLLVMSDQAFNLKYNAWYLAAATVTAGPQITQAPNIVVNVPGNTGQGERRPSEVDVATQLEKLHQLRVSGAISTEEFEAQKARLLQAA